MFLFLTSYSIPFNIPLMKQLNKQLNKELYKQPAVKPEKAKRAKTKPLPGNSMRISVRIASVVTSLSIKKNLIALWILLGEEELSEGSEQVKRLLTDFVYECLDQWDHCTAKGFSDFVSDKLIESILEVDDYNSYKRILGKL